MQTLWIVDFHLKIWESEKSTKNLFRLAFFLIGQWCRVDTRHFAKALYFDGQAGRKLAEVPKWLNPNEIQTKRRISAHTTNQAQENWVVNRIGESQPQNAQPSWSVEGRCFWDDDETSPPTSALLDDFCGNPGKRWLPELQSTWSPLSTRRGSFKQVIWGPANEFYSSWGQRVSPRSGAKKSTYLSIVVGGNKLCKKRWKPSTFKKTGCPRMLTNHLKDPWFHGNNLGIL